jgi:hypothetical protein
VTSGNIQLKVYKTIGDNVINQNATIPWNASPTDFCKGLNAFNWFKLSTFGVTCTSTMKNAAGADTTDAATAVEFTWRVSIDKLRTDKGYDFAVTYTAGSGVFTSKNIQ